MILRAFLRACWSMGILFVEEWDGPGDVLPTRADLKAKKDKVKTVRDLFMELRRWDGRNGSPDYREPSFLYDGEVWKRKGWEVNGADMVSWDLRDEKVELTVGDSKQRENYIKVRPMVCRGLPASKIAEKMGKSLRWAEEYVAAVREGLWLRYCEDVSAPPLSQREEG